MRNSYLGELELVKTLLEMGLVSIDDKDKVSSLAVAHTFHPPAITAHFHITPQDGRTMLDYAKIAKSKGRNWNQLDATIAFLQSCSCLPELRALVLTRSRHVQTSLSLPPSTPKLLS
jgi:hypothetical protein